MARNKLLRPNITLKVGDYLKEVDSYARGTYRVYKITEIIDASMRMDILFEFNRCKKVTFLYTPNIRADIDAHHYIKGDRYKTYFLGNINTYSVLYGN